MMRSNSASVGMIRGFPLMYLGTGSTENGLTLIGSPFLSLPRSSRFTHQSANRLAVSR